MKHLLLVTFLITSLKTFAQIPSYIPKNGLVAWYPFTGNALDSSGNGHNGTLHGNLTLVPDRFGNSNSAYSWPTNGASENYIDIGRLDSYIPNSITISAWIYMDGGVYDARVISTGEQGIICNGSPSNTSRTFKATYDASGTQIWPSTYKVPALSWHQIVYTSDNSKAKFFVDGQLVDSSTAQIPKTLSTDIWNIGRKSINAYDGWGGKLDDICIWNRALSDNEVIGLSARWVLDSDGDGYYTGTPVTQYTAPAAGYVTKTTQKSGDCNDADVAIHPGARDIADDGIDQNCDGYDLKTWYRDADKDGYGNIDFPVTANTKPSGYVTNHDDCDDTNAAIKPTTVWVLDGDKDGYYIGSPVTQCTSPGTSYVIKIGQKGGDCNDANATIHPDATEIADDGIDQNCDGYDLKTWYRDADGDGFGNINLTKKANNQPSGYIANHTDCNDSDKTIYPGAPELCDGKDNNCNGETDENCPPPTIKINNVTKAEGNSGQANMVFTVTISPKPSKTVTVDYTTKDNTASSSSDYLAASGTLTFAPGVATQTIAVVINGDMAIEKNESFKVILSNVVNAQFGDSSGTGNITNDDLTTMATLTAKQSSSRGGQSLLLSVSPNPANSIIQVHLSSYRGKVRLQLTELSGRVLREATVQSTNVKSVQQQFSVAGLASGTYWMVAIDDQGNRQSQKIVVVH